MQATVYPHIVGADPATAAIDETRYKVSHLAAEHYQYGWTAEELLRQHPDLRPEQMYAALAYFYDHRDAILDALGESARSAEQVGKRQGLSRAELLSRQG